MTFVAQGQCHSLSVNVVICLSRHQVHYIASASTIWMYMHMFSVFTVLVYPFSHLDRYLRARVPDSMPSPHLWTVTSVPRRPLWSVPSKKHRSCRGWQHSGRKACGPPRDCQRFMNPLDWKHIRITYWRRCSGWQRILHKRENGKRLVHERLAAVNYVVSNVYPMIRSFQYNMLMTRPKSTYQLSH